MIPYRIYQTFKTNEVPEDMYKAVKSYIDLNPEYDYYFYDDQDIENLIENFNCNLFTFSKDDLKKAYKKMNTGAGKSDLFRYMIIFQEGGCYFDIDTVCLNPLDTFIEPEDEFVSGIGSRNDLHQFGLIYTKKHMFIRKTLENCVYNILNENYIPGFHKSLEYLTVPPCLDYSVRT